MYTQVQTQAAVSNYLLIAAIKKIQDLENKMGSKLSRINESIAEKRPVFMVRDALPLFRKHLISGVSRKGRRFKKPENYYYTLRRFGEVFRKQNLAAINAGQLNTFLNHFWKTPGTIQQRRNELSSFFSWAIMHLRKHGKPSFSNPCALLDPLPHRVKQPVFIETAEMRRVIESAQNERQWLLFAIMATAGLRVSEALGLRKEDVNGRILTLYDTKAGNEEEIAVIPEKVAMRLSAYMRNLEPDDLLFTVSRITVHKALRTRGQHPHALRKWCITYWDRKSDPQMEQFVRRHSRTSLRDRYVAPLTAKEAIIKQRILEKELWR